MISYRIKKLQLMSVLAVMAVSSLAVADDANTDKYVFRYKFQPGDVLQWEVTAQISQLTSHTGNRNNTETLTITTKNWNVLDVVPDGTTILEYSFPDIAIRSLSSSDGVELNYNSKTDAAPPVEFLDVAELVGEPIAHLTINPQGEIVKRSQKAKVAATIQLAEAAEENRITIPMPEHAVGVGDA